MEKMKWILAVLLTAIVISLYMSARPGRGPATASVPRLKKNVIGSNEPIEIEVPPGTKVTDIKVEMVPPTALPPPTDPIKFVAPPKNWKSQIGAYQTSFRLSEQGRRISIMEIIRTCANVAKGMRVNYSDLGPVYLVHELKNGKPGDLRVVIFTADQELGNGKKLTQTYYATKERLSVLNVLVPRDRPLSKSERAEMVLSLQEVLPQPPKPLICELVVTVCYGKIAQQEPANFVSMEFDLGRVTNVGDGNKTIEYGTVTNRYVFSRTASEVYVATKPLCWR